MHLVLLVVFVTVMLLWLFAVLTRSAPLGAYRGLLAWIAVCILGVFVLGGAR